MNTRRTKYYQRILVLLSLSLLFMNSVTNVYAGDNLWTPMGPYGVVVNSLAIAPNNNQVIYAGMLGGQTSVFKSIDGGTTWFASSNGITSGTTVYYGFAFDPNDPNTIYVATDAGLYKSTDAGETWILKSSLLIDGVARTLPAGSIAISPTDGTLYMGIGCQISCDSTAGIYRSHDGGETWEHVFTDTADVRPIAIALSAPHIIYAGIWTNQNPGGGSGSIFKSTDWGNTWQRIDSSFGAPVHVRSITVDPQDAQVVYLGVAGNGIFKTSNGGQTWTPIGTSLGSITPKEIKVDPRNQQVMYLASWDETSSGVYRSLDNAGLSWAAMNDGMGNRSVYSLAIDNGSPQNIYAGTTNGVWKYTVTSGHTDDSISINNGTLFTNQTTVTLTLTAPPLTDQMIISNDGGFGGASWEPFATQKPWTITSYGSYVIPRVVYAKFRTNGQVSGQYQDDIILDQTPPTGTMQITGEITNTAASLPTVAAYSSAPFSTTTTYTIYLPLVTKNYIAGFRVVGLSLSATDDVSGVDSILISNDAAFTGPQWQAYVQNMNWYVNEKGTTTVYLKYRDRARNESQVYLAVTTAP